MTHSSPVNTQPVAWIRTWPDGERSVYLSVQPPQDVEGVTLTPLYLGAPVIRAQRNADPTAWDRMPHLCSVCRKPIADKADHVVATRLMHRDCAGTPPQSTREADLRNALEFGILSCSGPTNDAEVKLLDEQVEETWQEYRAALSLSSPDGNAPIGGTESCTCHFFGAGAHHVPGCPFYKIITSNTADSVQPLSSPEGTGFFAKLTPEQQKAALEYDGPENHGDPAFRHPLSSPRRGAVDPTRPACGQRDEWGHKPTDITSPHQSAPVPCGSQAQDPQWEGAFLLCAEAARSMRMAAAHANVFGRLSEAYGAVEVEIKSLAKQAKEGKPIQDNTGHEWSFSRPDDPPQEMPVSMTELCKVIYAAGEGGTAGVAEAILDAYHVTRHPPQPVPVTADQAAEDVRREREAKSERDRYANMTTAEKCAVQGDGFINDYD